MRLRIFQKFTKRLPKLGNRLLRRLSRLISEELDQLPPLQRAGRLHGAWF